MTTETRILIAGSRYSRREALVYARRVVQRAKDRGYTVLVGDNPRGVDAVVVQTCRLLRVPVIVAGIAHFPRNAGCPPGSYVQIEPDLYRAAGGYRLNGYTVRDRWLVDNASLGIFIWNGDSPGTKAGYDYAIQRGKTAHLLTFPVKGVQHD